MAILKRLTARERRDNAQERTKLEQLSHLLIRDLLVSAAVLLVLGAVAYGADQWRQTREEARVQLDAKVKELANQVTTLQAKLKKAEDSLPVYTLLTQQHAGAEIPLDREQANKVLDTMKEDLQLQTLRGSLSPIHEMEATRYKNRFLTGEYCEVSLGVDALSDEHVIALLHELRNRLSGKLRILHFTLARTGKVTPQIVTSIAQTGKVSLIKSDVRMQWMGMKATPAPVPGGEKKP